MAAASTTAAVTAWACNVERMFSLWVSPGLYLRLPAVPTHMSLWVMWCLPFHNHHSYTQRKKGSKLKTNSMTSWSSSTSESKHHKGNWFSTLGMSHRCMESSQVIQAHTDTQGFYMGTQNQNLSPYDYTSSPLPKG